MLKKSEIPFYAKSFKIIRSILQYKFKHVKEIVHPKMKNVRNALFVSK